MFYNASLLATTGNVIVVTVNYRLGVFGFLTLDSADARGNYGLWDQIQALKWVNENIESFGGDSGSVTIFGESAGGFSVSLLALYPANKGLFQRVIAQSGTSHSFYALSPISGMASKMISNYLGCTGDTTQSVLSCLRDKSAEEVLKAAAPTNFASPSDFHLTIGIGPVIDGELIPDIPVRLVSNAYPEVNEFLRSLDYITGTSSSEGSLLYFLLSAPPVQEKHNFVLYEGIPTEVFTNLVASTLVGTYYHNNTEIWKAICDMYTDTTSLTAQSMAAVNMYGDFFFVAPAVHALLLHSIDNNMGQTYQYEMARESPVPFGIDRPAWFSGNGHADELFYLFGMKIKQLQGQNVPEGDLALATQMMQYWSNFAKTG